MKNFIPVIMVPCLFFFWLGWSFGPSEEKVVEKVIEKEIEKKIYVKSQDDSSKDDLKKREEVAKAYYEKAFALFLANLGLKLSDSNERELQQLINNPQEYLARTPTPRNQVTKTESPLFMDLDSQGQDFSTLPDWLKESSKGKILKEPNVAYANSQYINDSKKLKRYLGEYKGELFLTQGSNAGQVHQVYMDIDFTSKDDGGIDGKFNLQLFNGEKIYSDNRGTGGNRDVRELEDHLIIDVGPGWFFMFPNGNLNRGHYYQEGKYQGIVRFQKQ